MEFTMKRNLTETLRRMPVGEILCVEGFKETTARSKATEVGKEQGKRFKVSTKLGNGLTIIRTA